MTLNCLLTAKLLTKVNSTVNLVFISVTDMQASGVVDYM